MPLRFSEEGPEFPSTLVDALLKGEVVFLCGAGISAPQLPGFARLVDRCYDELNLEKDRSEHLSYEAGRFEEVLGSLSRRIVDPDELVRTVSGLVKLPKAPDLTRHQTILRLSRDLENRPTIVTTNFDTLIEHALRLEDLPLEAIARTSFAGQTLPLPGSANFHGIIHIHGRIADPAIGVDESALIMTSADYGDAYMRSGWVSRFLFDLCRCKTVVLVGYSANDAPVRYFLNVWRPIGRASQIFAPCMHSTRSEKAKRTQQLVGRHWPWRLYPTAPLSIQTTSRSRMLPYGATWRSLPTSSRDPGRRAAAGLRTFSPNLMLQQSKPNSTGFHGFSRDGVTCSTLSSTSFRTALG